MTDHARRQARFDPYAILHALEREHAFYILVGGLARVLEGSGEITRGVDLAPSLRPDSLRRLETALVSLDARPVDGGPRPLDGRDVGLDTRSALSGTPTLHALALAAFRDA